MDMLAPAKSFTIDTVPLTRTLNAHNRCRLSFFHTTFYDGGCYVNCPNDISLDDAPSTFPINRVFIKIGQPGFFFLYF